MNNRRLLTSGCSYTDYCWSTWSDILGTKFSEYRQVGQGGCDNAFIARSIVNNARADDVVVIMWTSYDRWSFYSDNVIPLPKDANNHWKHLGSHIVHNKEFFVNYYNRVERFHTTMDYIQLVDLHSQVNDYDVYHFSAFPLFLAETEKNIDPKLVEICSRYDIKNNYLLDTSLDEYRLSRYNIITNHEYCKNDGHPTPLCHWDYAEQFIAPKLNVNLSQERKQSIIKEQQDLISK